MPPHPPTHTLPSTYLSLYSCFSYDFDDQVKSRVTDLLSKDLLSLATVLPHPGFLLLVSALKPCPLYGCMHCIVRAPPPPPPPHTHTNRRCFKYLILINHKSAINLKFEFCPLPPIKQQPKKKPKAKQKQQQNKTKHKTKKQQHQKQNSTKKKQQKTNPKKNKIHTAKPKIVKMVVVSFISNSIPIAVAVCLVKAGNGSQWVE